MLFGPIGRQVSVPWPQSGMGQDSNLYTETTDLLSGEQSVYRAPVTYKTFHMSWKGNSTQLQGIIDCHTGIYGNGPYYITDPMGAGQGTNLLPAKWAASHLLQYIVNGWCSPVITPQMNTPERRQVTFTGNADHADYCPQSIIVPVVPKQPLYFRAWGTYTGAARMAVSRYTASTNTWSAYTLYAPTLSSDAPWNVVTQAEANAGDIQAVKITLYVPGSDTMTLQHLDLAINDYRYYTPLSFGLDPSLYPSTGLYPGMSLYPMGPDPSVMFRSGKGTGPVQFTGNVGGTIDSVTIDRIGLTLELREVSRDPNN